MTLQDAKDCVKNKYPKAASIYSQQHHGTFIHTTRYILSPIIGPALPAQSVTVAWKETALLVFEGKEVLSSAQG